MWGNSWRCMSLKRESSALWCRGSPSKAALERNWSCNTPIVASLRGGKFEETSGSAQRPQYRWTLLTGWAGCSVLEEVRRPADWEWMIDHSELSQGWPSCVSGDKGCPVNGAWKDASLVWVLSNFCSVSNNSLSLLSQNQQQSLKNTNSCSLPSAVREGKKCLFAGTSSFCCLTCLCYAQF